MQPNAQETVSQYLARLAGAYQALTQQPAQAQNAPAPAPVNANQAQAQGAVKNSWLQNLISIFSSEKWSPPGWFPWKVPTQ